MFGVYLHIEKMCVCVLRALRKIVLKSGTVPICNPCTNYVGSSGLIHDRTPNCNPVSRAWMHG